jgi:hypothetical protein
MNFNIKNVKIVVTVPVENSKEVIDAMCGAGAGAIGNYSYCTSTSKSIGTFIPDDNANPYIGESNKLEVVNEDRIEVICEVEKVKHVVEELRKAHPYEEPAIDIYPILNEEDFK